MPEESVLASLISHLSAMPVAIAEAGRQPSEGGLPMSSGFYAWWAHRDAISSVPTEPHPLDPAWGLFYVGIAPRDDRSKQMLRTRVLNNHASGNTGASTFRFALASLLREELALHPEKRKSKYVLPREENESLSAWQRRHLSLTWGQIASPWVVEAEVIQAMKPALNSADNKNHPFHQTLTQARTAFRQSARAQDEE